MVTPQLHLALPRGKPNRSLLLHRQGLVYGARQLVRTAGALDAALYAMEAARNFACIHTLDQRGQTAEIAHATARKLQVVDASILNCELDFTRTCTVWCVCILLFHCILVFVKSTEYRLIDIPPGARKHCIGRSTMRHIHRQKRSPTWVGCGVSATIPKVSRDTFRVGDDGCVLEVGLEPTQPVMAKGF